ncbi:MAG: hypothetical protein AABX33_05210 [Nanoarchaeota archaeon]
MAEQKPLPRRFLNWRTNLWRGLRFIGFPVHFGPEEDIKNIGIYQKLKKEIEFDTIQKLNKEMVEAELSWDGLEGKGQEPSAQFYRNRLRELYSEFVSDKHEIGSSIGPFINEKSLLQEYKLSDSGTFSSPTEQPPVELPIDLTASGGGIINVRFNLPPEKWIVHKNLRYQVAYFGARNSEYWNQLDRDIEKICADVKAALPNNQRVGDNIKIIHSKIMDLKKYLQQKMVNFEEEHRKALGGSKGEGGVLGRHAELRKLRQNVMKKRLGYQKVHYAHTYKVIKPLDSDGRLLDDAENPTNDNINTLPANFKRPEEVAPGLDKNGYPLEVGDGETLFEGKPLEKGKVLIDIYEGRPRSEVRTVPSHFIEDCDLLDIAYWVYVSYDAYRDDLRDGRYHKNAITVMERIMTELKSIDPRKPKSLAEKYNVHPQTKRDIDHGRHAKVRMILNKLSGKTTETSLRPPSDPEYVEMTIRPSHLNPAFDPRAEDKDKHIGRKYYYDLQENILSHQSEKPTITTRGAALYILHRVIEETKYWGGTGDPNKAGVMEVLEAIGDAIGGYDIGPNIGLVTEGGKFSGTKYWGHDLPRNPFKPRS